MQTLDSENNYIDGEMMTIDQLIDLALKGGGVGGVALVVFFLFFKLVNNYQDERDKDYKDRVLRQDAENDKRTLSFGQLLVKIDETNNRSMDMQGKFSDMALKAIELTVTEMNQMRTLIMTLSNESSKSLNDATRMVVERVTDGRAKEIKDSAMMVIEKIAEVPKQTVKEFDPTIAVLLMRFDQLESSLFIALSRLEAAKLSTGGTPTLVTQMIDTKVFIDQA